VRWPIKLETHSTHAGTSELLPASSKCCTSPLGLASPGEWQQLCSTNVPATTKRRKFHAEVRHKGPLKDGRRLAQAIGLSFAATFCPSRRSFGHPAITVTWNHRASLSLAFPKARREFLHSILHRPATWRIWRSAKSLPEHAVFSRIMTQWSETNVPRSTRLGPIYFPEYRPLNGAIWATHQATHARQVFRANGAAG